MLQVRGGGVNNVSMAQSRAAEGLECLVAVTPDAVMRLRLHPNKPGFASVTSTCFVCDLLKITTRKSVQDLVVFHFSKAGACIGVGASAVSGAGPTTEPPPRGIGSEAGVVDAYVITGSRGCIELVKQHYKDFVGDKAAKGGRAIHTAERATTTINTKPTS